MVVIYISFRFEPKMALAAFIAMLHDLLVTVGIYSLAGFQVTPDTVIAVLTILGYSLYDTVVVFDRVRDNTKGFGASGRMTYSEMVNLSMNQTLARSINTSLVAILPVLSVLVIGAELLGATTLQYYGLALIVGLSSGAYSSIFIASPVLAMLKEREPRYIASASAWRAGPTGPACSPRPPRRPWPRWPAASARPRAGPARRGRPGGQPPGRQRAAPGCRRRAAGRPAAAAADDGGRRSTSARRHRRPPAAAGRRRPAPRRPAARRPAAPPAQGRRARARRKSAG